MVTFYSGSRYMGRCRYRPLQRPSLVATRLAEQWSTVKRFTSRTSPQRWKPSFPNPKQDSQSLVPAVCSRHPCCEKVLRFGAISIRRTEVRPFSERHIALLKTFADQAVIAIENVRLFKELQERTRELVESVEHQTATSEVLGIISRSPTDAQPVLDAIVESAARVCGIDDVVLRLREGNNMVARAHFGPVPLGRIEISSDDPRFRWVRDHGALHIHDVRERRND